MKIVIVGGVAGGASAAARARRLSEDAEIIMFDRGPYISFANCGLPYHIGGEIEDRNALLLQTPESFRRRFNVEVRLHSEVVDVDSEAKTVTVKDVNSGDEYRESYDALVLSPGAAPFIPPIPGIENPLTHTLRNIPDMDRILRDLDQLQPKHVTVVGGGFIGLEAAEALRHRGLEVTILELSAQVMAPVDGEMATPLHQEIRDKGVDLRLGCALQSVEPGERQLRLNLENGESLDTGMLLLAIGVQPETDLAQAAGIALGESGGIKVDRYMRTSVADIYAVGDAVEVSNFVSGEAALIPLAGPANRQGRNAASNISGQKLAYNATQGTAVCRVFDLTVACTGLNEKALRRSRSSYEKVYVHAMDHAGYFPAAEMISLKLLFEPESGRVLGAQAVGKAGVDKRIDVIAVAIRAHMTVQDLEQLELCYAPPYGSAKDVVNLAGFVAANLLRGDIEICHVRDALQKRPDQQILDVRNPAELERIGAIEGALNIPVDELRQRLSELDKETEYLVTCMVGLRAHVAYRLLVNSGFKAKNISGGFKTWLMTTGQQDMPLLVAEGG
jgi:NADPH-dependent 2,4-dienoyl-CoA reductase/sulfur reductase-like enzyme/rhodanese-related sulfurtransferase